MGDLPRCRHPYPQAPRQQINRTSFEVPFDSFPNPPTSYPHPPTSFPRRRESPPPCISFDRTELKYYSRTMTTQRIHHPRHSREGGNPLRCAQLPKRQPPPAVDGNRQDATGCSRAQRKLVPARARTRHTRQRRSVHFLSSWIVPRPQQVGLSVIPPGSRHSRTHSPSFLPGLAIPEPSHVIPAKAGISRCAIRRTA